MAYRRIAYAALLGGAVLFQIVFRFYLSTFTLALVLLLPLLSVLLSLPSVLGCTLLLTPAAPTVVQGEDAVFQVRLRSRTRGVVTGKYLFTLLVTLASTVFVSLLLVVLALAGGLEEPLSELLLSALACAGIALIMNAVALPLLLKFGAEKARMVSMALFLLVFAGFALLGLAADRGPVVFSMKMGKHSWVSGIGSQYRVNTSSMVQMLGSQPRK